jgi:hypothetical protein
MNRSNIVLKMLIPALALAACAASISTAETIWNLENDFSTAANPNGAWTYGVYLDDDYNSSIGPWYAWAANWGPYGTSPANTIIPHMYVWGNSWDANFNCGGVCSNPDQTDATYHVGSDFNLWLRPGQVASWAAAVGSGYSPVVRWTAPSDMTVSVDALFTGHTDHVLADVHVLLNGDQTNGLGGDGLPIYTGTHLLDGAVNGNYGCAALGIAQTGTAPSQSYADTINLHAGDKLDFVVGYGPDHAIPQDLVGLSVNIQQIPEPSTIVLLLVPAGLALTASRRRRRLGVEIARDQPLKKEAFDPESMQ